MAPALNKIQFPPTRYNDKTLELVALINLLKAHYLYALLRKTHFSLRDEQLNVLTMGANASVRS